MPLRVMTLVVPSVIAQGRFVLIPKSPEQTGLTWRVSSAGTVIWMKAPVG